MTKAKQTAKDVLATREKELTKQHGKAKIVAGSIRKGKGKHEGKLTVKINTRGEDGKFDGKTLVVATSDLHQTNSQPGVAEALRRKRRNEKARANRAAVTEAKKTAAAV